VTSTSSKSTRVRRDPIIALDRSRMYLLLSLGFRYPAKDTLAALREELGALLRDRRPPPEISDLRRAARDPLPLPDSLAPLAKELRGLRLEALESEYLRVFTHVITSDCHPCETAYTATHLFQQSQKLADLSGFYRAFGVEPNAERADHVSVELEFMAYLAQKEAHALANGRPRKAETMRRTERGFLEDHLGVWVRTFARFVEKKAESGVYAALAKLALAFFEVEFSTLRASVREITGPPKPLPLLQQKELEDEDDDCPLFATAESSPVNARAGVLGAAAEVESWR
jgi:DMSO reductase family type II enzyme chaperone